MHESHKSVIVDGSLFRKFTWGSNKILLRALSIHEIEWIEREHQFLGFSLPNDMDYLVWSFVVWNHDFMDDFTFKKRRQWAEKIMKIPLTILEPMIIAYREIQQQYLELGKTFYSSLTSVVSRQMWGMYLIHGESLFKKFHFWNDYQTDFFLFHRREDVDERMDFVFSGFKMVVNCFSKLPDTLSKFQLSRTNSENRGDVHTDVTELDEQIKNELAGVEDHHARIVKAAEKAYHERMVRQRELMEARKKEVEIPDIPSMLLISPADLVERSRERRCGQ